MCSTPSIADNLRRIHEQIELACERSNRDPAAVTVLGASKSQPVGRLMTAWDAGLRIFGENRIQEALTKIEQLPADAEWHLIGPLQSNKVKKAVPIFAAVHSIDRLKIARALDREATRTGKRLVGFVEINLAGEQNKHGFAVQNLVEQLQPLTELETLQIVGFMAIPPLEPERQGARVWFRQLRQLRDEICSHSLWSSCPGQLSMGMSQDYDVAVEEGATHLRIGSSLFGPRPKTPAPAAT